MNQNETALRPQSALAASPAAKKDPKVCLKLRGLMIPKEHIVAVATGGGTPATEGRPAVMPFVTIDYLFGDRGRSHQIYCVSIAERDQLEELLRQKMQTVWTMEEICVPASPETLAAQADTVTSSGDAP